MSTKQMKFDTDAHHAFMEGIDQMGYLQQNQANIKAFEQNRSWNPSLNV